MTFEEFISEWKSPCDFIEAQTSGSTGNPKKIMLRKEFVRASALRTNSFFKVSRSSRLHSCVAPDFIGGKMMAVRACVAGCRLTWEKPSNRPLESLSKRETIDLLAVVPSQMLHVLANMSNLPFIKAVIIGGSNIDPTLREKIAGSGINAFETYGMTETASHVALRRVEVSDNWFATLPGITVGQNERGCLVVSFSTGERFVTNDLAELRSESEFRIMGRHDHIIVTGGRKVNPFIVEAKIASCIGFPYVVTSLPDEKWGSRVVLRIEGELDDSRLSRLAVQLRERLEPWETPKQIICQPRLERTANGKIKRR